MAAEHGADEAARRYRAIVITTLRQLRGLSDARLRLIVAPEDAHEAVRFWILPRLAESWQALDTQIFRCDGWEIEFGGGSDEFPIHASGEILCPNLGARWVHAALLGMGRTTHQVVGPAIGGGEYFRAHAKEVSDSIEKRVLPELPVIQTDADWRAALDSALGPALKRAWEEEAH
ncbi:MAG: hypothetical protein RLZZ245_1212 [Verrucomicrobiota bacterium]|jgi:hypothetical protein